jgi:GntR family transcriptional regulator/MocR family aminotransferase
MWKTLFAHNPAHEPTLQGRLRTLIVRSILDGVLTPGTLLPSSRELSKLLKVSRNTVTLVYQQLTDQAYLEVRPRSGYRVGAKAAAQLRPDAAPEATAQAPDWPARLPRKLWALPNIRKPANWQDYPYPFVYGQFDASLFPAREWRECVIGTLRASAVRDWAIDRIDQDDARLVEQIQQRILPARGIWVSREEILVTAGAQQANYILAEILFGLGTRLRLEEPGYPDVRNIYASRGATIEPLKVGPGGLDLRGPFQDYVYVTPSHQCPTTVTMPEEQRRRLLEMAISDDFVIIEDDYDSELNFDNTPSRALKSLDRGGRVIYVGSLSKTIAPGLRVGFMVAPPALIREARAARRLMMRHPPTNNERALALFVSLGHHDMLIRRLTKAYDQRLAVLGEAVRRYLPTWRFAAPTGGSALWVQASAGVSMDQVAQEALAEGVVLESGSIFFSQPQSHFAQRYARLGVASIQETLIPRGIQRLAQAARRCGS